MWSSRSATDASQCPVGAAAPATDARTVLREPPCPIGQPPVARSATHPPRRLASVRAFGRCAGSWLTKAASRAEQGVVGPELGFQREATELAVLLGDGAHDVGHVD